MSSFFVRAGTTVTPTVHAASPWNPETQAGGAPAALLAALAEERGRPELRAARATVDILGPVPMRPGHAVVTPVRSGRATEFFTASLVVDDVERLRLGLWRVAPAPALPPGTPAPSSSPAPTPGPDDLTDHRPPPPFFTPTGYVAAMQWRMARGGFDVAGPATAWSRPRYPLLPGVPAPAIARLLLAGATANGLSSVLDLSRHLAIDVEYSVHLTREPLGSWLCTDAVTDVAQERVGHVRCTFSDEDGAVGGGAQTLLVAPRERR